MLEKIKLIFINKYLRSIVRNFLQFSFGAITSFILVVGQKYNLPSEDLENLKNIILSLKEPLELVLIPLLGSLLVAASSLSNAKKGK